MNIKGAVVCLVLFAASCERSDFSIYPTYAEAEKDGAIDRGWIPNFVPRSAKRIVERHNMDVDQIAIAFDSTDTEFINLLSSLEKSKWGEAGRFFQTVSFPGDPLGRHGNYYYYCSDDGIGLLTSDLKSKRFYYFEPVKEKSFQALCAPIKP
ncbi:MAG: hypothetical protein JF600_16990 [Xanthomonadales bacterium]|nr:hypothetical protein [Xanthomonadales bacterium]